MSTSKILLTVVVLTLALVGFQFWRSSNTHLDTLPISELAMPTTRAPDLTAIKPLEVGPRENPTSTVMDQTGCLTFGQFQELPELLADVARMEPVATSGSALNAYVGLDEVALRSFAEQGDSAAMLIIGANAVMRAYDVDQSLAIAWLNHEQQMNDLSFGTEDLSANSSLELNDAAYWFYEAATHGRLMALQKYGMVRGRLFGGAIGLGWVSSDEYDALSNSERNALVPSNLYTQVAYDIAPALREGALGILSRIGPESELQRVIRSRAVSEFEQAQFEAGLPPVEVAPTAPTASADIEILFDRICESEKHKDLRRRSLE